MKIGPVAETLVDRVALLLRLGPRPLLETHAAPLLARAVMVATKVGVFEALAASPLTSGEVAARCATDERATAKLLHVLAATGYVRATSRARFGLTRDARTWLVRGGPHSLRDNVLFRFVEWGWITRLEQFVVSGTPVDIHSEMSEEEWGLYQLGMRSLAGAVAREVALRTPVPRGARAMLDVGGAHGFFSAVLCRRHPGLRAEILDLDSAVASSAGILAREGLGDRVAHRVADARTADFGVGSFDLVLMSNLLHHVDQETGRDMTRRAARALRPGGVLVVQELVTPAKAGAGGQVEALADLYFALTSEAGTRSFGEFAAWQREAGLAPRRPIRFLSFPGAGQQSARKP
jgi:2-polyprenyl-3-methyl-5-hydroxy-6-metoxy-1,4-benzoquinol methylase